MKLSSMLLMSYSYICMFFRDDNKLGIKLIIVPWLGTI